MTQTLIDSTEEQAAILIQKIKHYLITTTGRVLEEAHTHEFYLALSYAIREQIMVNWRATAKSWMKKDARLVFYLSTEYLPGRFLHNNLVNLKNLEVIKLVLKKTGRSMHDVEMSEYDPGLGNGGLGRLASCFLDSLATLQMPARGYGLRYQYGLFEQQLPNRHQVEKPDLWLADENPWLFRRDSRRVKVSFLKSAEFQDACILEKPEEVWAFPFDVPIVGYSHDHDFPVVTLRLWSTKESPRNFELQEYNAGRLDQAAENMTLTDVLYPTDTHEMGKRVRLKQEYLLVSASLQDIFRYYFARHDSIDNFADKVRIQINDTHPALLVAELMWCLTEIYALSWEKAWDVTQTCVSYTNHTILSEALEEWDTGLVRYLLPKQYRIIERINHDFCQKVRQHYPNDESKVHKMSIIEKGKVRMAHLAICGSHKVNGVAKLHTDIIKSSVFKEFNDMFSDRFVNVTNGVTHRRWLLNCNPALSSFISKRIGTSWETEFSDISALTTFAKDSASQKEFLEIKKQNKQRLLDFLQADDLTLDETALFDIQIKRIHEYKRQLMNALRLIISYNQILENPNQEFVKRIVFFGGKAAASYTVAKAVINLISCIAKKVNSDSVANRFLNVHFIENYNVSKAELLIPAADLSEQISTSGMEASGTGNMKFSMNGALTIGTDDGANVEMRQEVERIAGSNYWPFLFGASSEEISKLKKSNSYNPAEYYSSTPKIQQALNMLKNGFFAETDREREEHKMLFDELIQNDRFFVLYDLQNYVETQEKVDALYNEPEKWAEYAISNMASMGTFTTDRSIQDYAEKIWGLKKCPIDPEIYNEVRLAYLESTPSSLI